MEGETVTAEEHIIASTYREKWYATRNLDVTFPWAILSDKVKQMWLEEALNDVSS